MRLRIPVLTNAQILQFQGGPDVIGKAVQSCATGSSHMMLRKISSLLIFDGDSMVKLYFQG
jgi:hypothetical protein